MGCRPWGCKELLDTTEHARQKTVARVSSRRSLHEKSMEGFIQSEVHLSGAFIPSVTDRLTSPAAQAVWVGTSGLADVGR